MIKNNSKLMGGIIGVEEKYQKDNKMQFDNFLSKKELDL